MSIRNIAILSLLLCVSFLGFRFYQENTKVIPEELLAQALTNTLEAKSYRYQTKSTFVLNGEEKIFSDLVGEKSDETAFHVKGTMLKTPIDLYQIKDTTYRLDSLTNKWIIMENNSLLKESLLMTELNPLSNFYFKDIISASYLGKEKINRRNTYKLECIPVIENRWLDSYFKDLKYTLWVDKKDKLLKKAMVTANSKENKSGTITIEVELYDYHETIEIKPPII